MAQSFPPPSPTLGWFWEPFELVWHAFIHNFCLRLPLLAVLLLVLGLLLDQIGLDYGIPDLIYHEIPLKQFWVGLTLGLLTFTALMIGFLLWHADKASAPVSPKALPRWSFSGYAVGILSSVGLLVLATYVIISLSPIWGKTLGYRGSSGGKVPDVSDECASPCRLPLVAGGLVAWLMVWLTIRIAFAVTSVRTRELRAGALNRASRTAYRFFLFSLVLIAVLLYVGSSSLGSHGYWWLAALVFVGVGFLILVAASWLFAGEWETLRRTLAARIRMVDPQDNGYRTAALLMLGILVLNAIILSFSRPLNSPAATVGAFLCVLTAGYGLLAYLARRVVPLVVVGLIFLVILGGVPPNKMRFDGLPEDKGVYDASPEARADAAEKAEEDKTNKADDPEYNPVDNALLDLVAHSKADTERQNRFDDQLRKRVIGVPNPAIAAAIKEMTPRLRKQRVRAWVDPVPSKQLKEQFGNEAVPRGAGEPDLFYPAELEMLSGREGKSGPEPLAVISVSGGGLRAAVWTLRVLQRLEVDFAKKGIDFPSRVRVICGASGGMLGAAYYIATLPDRGSRMKTIRDVCGGNLDPERWKQMKEHIELLQSDFLTPIVQRAISNDVPALFSPWPNLRDRGKALEEAWRDALGDADGAFTPNGLPKNALDLTFADLRAREKGGCCPSLVFSPMMVEDGRRLLISNLDLRYVAANTGNRLGVPNAGDDTECLYSIEAMELFRLFPKAPKHFKLSTAVRMSASFPYFSPAVSLPTSPRRRVVDAGYYDNFGVSLGASWLFSGRNFLWIDKQATKIVLIQIRASISDEQRTLGSVPPEPSGVLSRAFEEAITPPEGMYNSVFSAASFRNDGQLELLSRFFQANRDKRLVEKFDREVGPKLKDKHKPKEIRDFVEDSIKNQVDRLKNGEPGTGKVTLRKRVLDKALELVPDGKPGVAEAVQKLTFEWLASRLEDPNASANVPHENRYFTTVTFELGQKAALSWYLSKCDKEHINQGIEGRGKKQDGQPPQQTSNVPDIIKKLAEWWEAPAKP